MPELPEVETVANGVHARTHGQTILSVTTTPNPQTFKSPEAELAQTLTGATIQHVRRVGKTIVATLSRPSSPQQPGPTSAELLVHLGMTGRLLVADPAVPLPAHTHAILHLSSGRQLRFVDPRRFGRLSVRSTPYTGTGAEPLLISEADFVALFRPRRTPIKAALLNQSLLHGVGNIYADEALARAGIRPRRQAARLTCRELQRLRSALQTVLARAIELGGSSVSDYVDAEGIAGFFQLEHLVYARTNQPCRTCSTPIRRIIIGGRSTHFCPVCQH